jgi:5-methylcytosine-specific restriction protein A
MSTYLFTWNPKHWDWDTLEGDVQACKRDGFFDLGWASGSTKKVLPGDRIFFIKLGEEAPTGIMGSGFATSECYEDSHYFDPNKTSNYNELRFDVLLNPNEEELLSKKQLTEVLPLVKWSPRASGMTIRPESAARLEELWEEHISAIGFAPYRSADEVDAAKRYFEGTVQPVFVNAYERNPRARKVCLEHHGCVCTVCRFDFAGFYGDLGAGFIHVHHLIPIAEIKEEYELNPLLDLIPVCPNCHAMLHKHNPPLLPKELQSRIPTANKPSLSTPAPPRV